MVGVEGPDLAMEMAYSTSVHIPLARIPSHGLNAREDGNTNSLFHDHKQKTVRYLSLLVMPQGLFPFF